MPDPLFYEALGPLPVHQVASLGRAALPAGADGSSPILMAAPLAQAASDAVTFLTDRRYREELKATRAAACFVSEAYAELVPDGCLPLVTGEPYAAYCRVAPALHRPRIHPAGAPPVHPEARLAGGVVLGYGAMVGPGAVIGEDAVVGAHTVIGPGVRIGRDACIGSSCAIGFALIGDRVRIMSGAVIGEAGFGVAESRSGVMDVPQLGRVVLHDGVSVGANACIDRGAWEDTVVGENTKIDNLVQIAHNVRLGRNCVLAAHTGISGSCVVGDGAMFGGRAGIADHVRIGSGVKVAAAAGVMKDIPAGEVWAGSPARNIRRFMRETAWLAREVEKRGGG